MTETCLPIVTWLKNWFTSTDDLLDKTYPVGSIYMSVNSTSPSTLFGGTWEKIQGRFLLASGTTSGEDPSVDNTYTLGDTDGSKDAVVVSHNHTQKPHNHTQNAHHHGMAHTHSHNHISSAYESKKSASGSAQPVPRGRTNPDVDGTFTTDTDSTASSKSNTDNTTATNISQTAENNPSGVSGTGKNMPPYLVVNVWERTA